MINQSILENGLRIVSKKLENTNSVTVLILVGAGSRYETLKMNGISHFLEHMFFKGAEKYKTTKEVSEVIDNVGGDFNAFTGKEYAGYYVKLSAENWKLAVDLLSDMLINSKFAVEEIDKERGVIMEEYNMYQDTPMYQIGWDFERLVFGEHPMGFDQVGTKDFINNVKREEFVDYMEKLYVPKNTVISVAGNIDHEEFMSEIKRLFTFKNLEKKLDFLPIEKLSNEKKIYVRNKKTEQAHVMVGYPSYSENDEKMMAAKLVSIILGGNMSSRMFLSVREAKGLAYYISTSTDEYSDVGTISTSAGVNVDKVNDALKAIVEEYEKAAREGFSDDELKKAKQYLKGKLVLRLEDSEEYAHLIGKYLLITGKIVGPEEIFKMVDEVSLEGVNEVAKNLFLKDEMRVAVVGPYENVEEIKID